MSTHSEDTEEVLSATLRQRANYIPIADLLDETASTGGIFKTITAELTNRAH